MYSIKPRKTRSLSIPKKPLILIAALILIGGGIFALNRRSDNNSTTTETTTEPTPARTKAPVDMSPATTKDEEDVDKHKEELPGQQNPTPTPTPSTQKKTVTPVIVDAGHYDNEIEVRSFIPGIYESGGTCTITLTKDGATTVTKQASSLQDATTTRCPNVNIPRSEFSAAGQWFVTVSYTSSSAQGTSEKGTVTIK